MHCHFGIIKTLNRGGENKPQAKLSGSIIEHSNSSLHEVNK